MSVKRYSVWEDEMFEEKHAINSTNGMVNLMVKHEDYAALEARCAALAAEVYDLKHPGTYLPSKHETPALDSFLAEVRAQGVEQLASLAGNECQRYKSVGDRAGVRKWKSIVILCTDFASQIRKEAK
jgi:hypothetical protein